MELKKYRFYKSPWDDDCYIVFAENEEEALQIINVGECGDDISLYYNMDDFYIEDLEIQNPSKAYKGYYWTDTYYDRI